MIKFLYVTKESLEELGTSTQLDQTICFSEEPFKNWIVSFDIIQHPEKIGFGIEYQVLRVPKEISDAEISSRYEELGQAICDIIEHILQEVIDSQ